MCKYTQKFETLKARRKNIYLVQNNPLPPIQCREPISGMEKFYGVLLLGHLLASLFARIRLQQGTPRDKYVNSKYLNNKDLVGSHPERGHLTKTGLIYHNIFLSGALHLATFLLYLLFTESQ